MLESTTYQKYTLRETEMTTRISACWVAFLTVHSLYLICGHVNVRKKILITSLGKYFGDIISINIAMNYLLGDIFQRM